jgi:transcriptional regulator with XRE-family HTH domain
MKPKDVNSISQRKAEKKEFAIVIGSHLRKIREARGISQENLSLKAGYYRTYVGKIEQGRYSPSLHIVWRLADALGMSLNSFFKNFK